MFMPKRKNGPKYQAKSWSISGVPRITDIKIRVGTLIKAQFEALIKYTTKPNGNESVIVKKNIESVRGIPTAIVISMFSKDILYLTGKNAAALFRSRVAFFEL